VQAFACFMSGFRSRSSGHRLGVQGCKQVSPICLCGEDGSAVAVSGEQLGGYLTNVLFGEGSVL
jgi:hypothetical protein